MRRRRISWSAFSYSQCRKNIFSPLRCMLINTFRPVTPLMTGQWPAMAVSMTSTRMRQRRIPRSAFSYSQCQANIFSPMRCKFINTLRPVARLMTSQWAAMAQSMTSTRMRRRHSLICIQLQAMPRKHFVGCSDDMKRNSIKIRVLRWYETIFD